MDYHTQDDVVLIELIKRAHTGALSTLYDRYVGLVYSLALNAVGDHGTAEEIAQDVFFRVWERADSYQPDKAKVGTWLASIARNRAIDVLRSRRSRPEAQIVHWAEPEAATLESCGHVDPQKMAESAWDRQRVRRAIAGLPPDQQEALAFAYFKGYSHRQIAELLEQPLGTVKTRIRLALQKLRESLEENGI